MDHIEKIDILEKKIGIRVEKGKIFFSREAERKFYFALSLILFMAGLFYKLGILQ